MENTMDMELTLGRQEEIKNILIRLWEDQMGYELERVRKEEKPA